MADDPALSVLIVAVSRFDVCVRWLLVISNVRVMITCDDGGVSQALLS